MKKKLIPVGILTVLAGCSSTGAINTGTDYNRGTRETNTSSRDTSVKKPIPSIDIIMDIIPDVDNVDTDITLNHLSYGIWELKTVDRLHYQTAVDTMIETNLTNCATCNKVYNGLDIVFKGDAFAKEFNLDGTLKTNLTNGKSILTITNNNPTLQVKFSEVEFNPTNFETVFNQQQTEVIGKFTHNTDNSKIIGGFGAKK
jgi:hypothetical protein